MPRAAQIAALQEDGKCLLCEKAGHSINAYRKRDEMYANHTYFSFYDPHPPEWNRMVSPKRAQRQRPSKGSKPAHRGRK